MAMMHRTVPYMAPPIAPHSALHGPSRSVDHQQQVTERSQAWSCDAPPSFHGAKAYTLDTAAVAFTLRAAVEHGRAVQVEQHAHATRRTPREDTVKCAQGDLS